VARILIIEDDELIAKSLGRLVNKFGHEPLGPVAYGEEAMEKIRESAPDLVLIDIFLKGDLDGIGLAIEMKRECDIPFVYITGNSDSETYKRAMDTGPAGYLRKPFVGKEWRDIIDKALSG
jgi:DNA-binding NtrC family response regulator